MPFGNHLAEVAGELTRLARDKAYRKRMQATRSARYWAAVWFFTGVCIFVTMFVAMGLFMIFRMDH
jgi:hypothetical protein